MPRSVCITFGNPKTIQNLISSRTIIGAFMERNAIASGKRVDVHIIVRMYSCPDFDLGRGPTQSSNKVQKVLS